MELFPVIIATGKAFCNRVQERQQLQQFIKNGRHVVIVAPRRYGKTSLINQVLLEQQMPFSVMELTLATTSADAERIITNHVADLLYRILPKTTKAKQNILKLFNKLNPALILNAGGQQLVFQLQLASLKPVDTIAESLKRLEDAAKLANKRVTVVMDEFQQLSEMEGHAIEASIRHAMQYSKHVSYVFSGSNRQMLISMFNGKNKPFYNSCEIIRLERISEDDYVSFIQSAAKSQWKKLLPETILHKIFELSELHPSYINRICGYFWLIEEFPTLNRIDQYWKNLIESKRVEFTETILNLSKNQRRIISYLSRNPTSQPSSQPVSQEIGLSEASIRQAMRKLMLQDHIYKDKKGVIRILDPAFRDFIKGLSETG